MLESGSTTNCRFICTPHEKERTNTFNDVRLFITIFISKVTPRIPNICLFNAYRVGTTPNITALGANIEKHTPAHRIGGGLQQEHGSRFSGGLGKASNETPHKVGVAAVDFDEGAK